MAPLVASNWQWKIPVSGETYMTFYDDSDALNPALRTFYLDSSLSLGYPAAANVRNGTVYGQTNNVTGTCAVPPAASVALGVPVDATTGTAILTAADFRSALGMSSANLDTQLTALTEAVEAVEARIAEQVPDGPVVPVPAPAAGQTTAWALCYNGAGVAEEGVSISVKLVSATGSGSAYDKEVITATSDANGMAALAIPRGDTLRFSARRGTGAWVTFSGVDAETLELPALLGNP